MTSPDRARPGPVEGAGSGEAGGAGGKGSSERRVIPFGVHQVGEYVFAAIFIFVAVHVSGRSQIILLAGGALLAALAALTDGPLGAWKHLSRRAHRSVDWIVVGVLALLPALPGRTLVSALLLEAMAFCQWRLSSMTRYQPRPARPARTGAGMVGPAARHLGRRSGAQLRRSVERRARRPQ